MFRIDGEVASVVDGEARVGAVERPDVVLETDITGFYFLVVEDRWDGVSVEGDRELVERFIEAVRGTALGCAAAAPA